MSNNHLTDIARRAARVTPAPRQLAWQQLEFTAFAHFGVNTFTDREWGDGTEDPRIFAPTALDAGQWVQTCRDAGMRMLILTAKHHDGFCLWPSRYTEHSVKNSPWRNGKGDVVREVADACREGGLRFGVYLSPWDRHEPTYGNSPAYNAHFKNQLRELLTEYGDIAEVWFDGACGEGPNGKRQVYDWPGYYALVRELQPDAVIFGCGPDVRWCGNEKGYASETLWSVVGLSVDLEHQVPNWEEYHRVIGSDPNYGTPVRAGATEDETLECLATAKHLLWYPAECDTSIRPGWFYHASQDEQVKSLEHLVDIYYQSVGRNAVLLLNVPPDQRGLMHENDAQRLRELRQTLDETFRVNLAQGKRARASNTRGALQEFAPERALDGDPRTYWTTDPDVTQASIEFDLGQPATFSRMLLQEHVAVGQRVAEYSLEAWDGADWAEVVRGTTIGYKKLDRFPATTTNRVRLNILSARDCPTLQAFGLY
ncbi:MAG: alpha-L-fucosidase [Chloroflexi bacterium]|jgi:alpha-L-fucosidase|nr:alpha-L-fucosidase [Chloroflexota bacterium]